MACGSDWGTGSCGITLKAGVEPLVIPEGEMLRRAESRFEREVDEEMSWSERVDGSERRMSKE